MEGRSTGTTVLGIKLSELKKLLILQPKENTVTYFESKVQSIMDLLEEKKKENEFLNELRNLLLSKLATLEDSL